MSRGLTEVKDSTRRVSELVARVRSYTQLDRASLHPTDLHEGLVDTIGSDQSPAPISMKEAEDFFAVWGGISGCQSLLSVVRANEHTM